MSEFANPYRTEDQRKDSPGETAQYWAGLAGMGLLWFGVKLTPPETEALAKVINAINRECPQMRQLALELEQIMNHKDTR